MLERNNKKIEKLGKGGALGVFNLFFEKKSIFFRSCFSQNGSFCYSAKTSKDNT